MRSKVAVIGSGVAGLTAAYILQRTCDVTLIEADSRLGGHAHTHELIDPLTLEPVNVDSGFIVHNEANYPTLMRIFRELGVLTQATQMSMSISCEECGLEYAGGAFRDITSELMPTYSNSFWVQNLHVADLDLD